MKTVFVIIRIITFCTIAFAFVSFNNLTDSWTPSDTPCLNSKIVRIINTGLNSVKYVICEDGSIHEYRVDSLNPSGYSRVNLQEPWKASDVRFQKMTATENSMNGVVVGNQNIFYTSNGGTSWTKTNINTGTDLKSVTYSPSTGSQSNFVFAVGEWGTIAISTDAGKTWNKIPSPFGLVANFNDVFFTSASVGWIVGDHGKILYTSDGGNSWTVKTESYPNSNFKGVWFNTPTSGILVSENGEIIKTSDNGQTWELFKKLNISLNDVAFSGQQKGLIVGDDGFVISSTNGGESWSLINMGTNAKLNNIEVDNDGYFHISSSDGKIYSNRPAVPLPGAPTNLNATLKGAGEVELSWKDNSDNEDGFRIYRKINTGNYSFLSYIPQNTNTYRDKNLDIGKTYSYKVCSYNYVGISNYSNEASILVTSIQNDEKELPTKYFLFQNYPNPFNPTTIIKYNVGESSINNKKYDHLVVLKVYDSLGKEVKTLVNERKSPGLYFVSFSGEFLSTGIYFYKITVDNYSAVRKMLLLK